MINLIARFFSTNSKPTLQLTLALIKPDIIGNRHATMVWLILSAI